MLDFITPFSVEQAPPRMMVVQITDRTKNHQNGQISMILYLSKLRCPLWET